MQGRDVLALPPDNPAVRRVAAQGHPDLLALERTEDEKGKMPTVISVDLVRKTIGFFGSTAGEGGWRVCIVDAADELNAAGANALLKDPRGAAGEIAAAGGQPRAGPAAADHPLALPPAGAAAARADDVARAVADALQRNADEADIKAATTARDGSVARALDLLAGTALQVRERVNTMLGALPAVDPRALHALGDALGRGDESAFTAFVDAVRDWLSARVTAAMAEPGRLARFAEVWDKLNRAAREVEIFHLERKPLVFNVFGWLAEASRG